ncbi:MAG TPA: acido-empty-quinoprotein group A [Bryobacteraceae bacterium]|jgi:alcohol dehydrogenase (cytochrome c)|nr:acido-empty-quinoprotein group A [Bryobacteraceae bacterium]
MTKPKELLLISALCLLPGLITAQGLDPALLTKPLSNDWPTYSGDYSGKRYSSLTQINQSNVKNLTLAWVSRMTAGAGGGGRGGGRGFGVGGAPTIVGGEGTGDATAGGGGANIRASVLEIDGTLYLSTPDNAWAVDARDGHELWHYFWKTKGGTHIGNRGLGMWGNWLYMETPDDYLVCLDARTGKERWHVEIADFNEQYFSTMAPIVVGNHILVGTGDDLDAPGFLQSRDPETGALQWKWFTVPQKKGDPGVETWGDLDTARHGGGNVWIPGAYDPDTHLYIFGTGNPSPAYTNPPGRNGDNLYTCSIVAVNVDTGKMAWYFQTSPHDTHDSDSTETPILVDAEFDGKPRKLLLHASRNGYYFTLDRVTGERLVTSKYSATINWARGLDEKGRPIRNPEKDSTVAGSLVSPNNGGATNWPPPAYSPDTGLFYVPTNDAYAMYYLTETDPRGAMGLGGKEEDSLGSMGAYLTAIDYKTGKVAWQHKYPGTGGNLGNGILATAGKLLFAGDLGGNLVAYDAANGKILWHTHLGNVSNAPETYMLDGHQFILVAGGDSLYTFTLY